MVYFAIQKVGRALVFGFLTTEKWWAPNSNWPVIKMVDAARNRVVRNPRRVLIRGALYHECRQQCKSGEEITSETAYINFTGKASVAYEHYTSLIAARNMAHKDNDIEAQPALEHSTPTTVWTFSGTEGSLDADAIVTQTDSTRREFDISAELSQVVLIVFS